MPGGYHLTRTGLLLLPSAILALFTFSPGGKCSNTPLGEPLQAAAPFSLEKGDHLCIIGNTLPDRMQHDGWLETYLNARHPDHNLTIRNLGFSGDEITLRLRSQDFGTPDQWLSGKAPIPNPGAVANKSGLYPSTASRKWAPTPM